MNSDLSGVRILLVEDNKENQLVATEILKDAGCVVTVAPDGLKAIEALKEAAFDIVLMDMQMPVLDGLTATMEIRKIPAYASLPIIAMTANAMKEEKERCLRGGMNDYITKPIDPPFLFETLRRFAPSGVRAAPAPASTPTTMKKNRAPTISGIEVEKSLGRMMGNIDLYIKLLKMFIQEQSSTGNKIVAALERNDYRTAEYLTHTLKGSAAIIGAVEIQRGSEKLESGIHTRDKNAALIEMAHHLELLLHTAIDTIEDGLAQFEKDSITSIGAFKEQEYQEILDTLTRLLMENDSEAIDYFESMHEQLSQCCGPEDFNKLESFMRSYNYPEALILLGQIDEHSRGE